MAITVEWDNQTRTVAIFHFTEGWTWDELYVAVARYNEMVDSVTHSVCMIIDIPPEHRVPPAFTTHAKNIANQMRPHAYGGVIVSKSYATRLIIGTLRNLRDPNALRFRFADSIDKARKMLAEPVR
ncbi:MAG TPA: hypothetical protein VHL11_06925 [Phototrophicaceae bacterium]|jgi:hypothetical protein|nr:hypothetical protein [Phototrophicaceae bacterium]